MSSTMTPATDRAALTDQLFALLPSLKRRLTASLPEGLSDELASVTPHQLEALHQLRAAEPPSGGCAGATMQELARAQHCALSTVTALADRLIRQGLAERRPDPADRRVVHLVVTPRGEELSRRFEEARRLMAVDALAQLSDTELATFVALVRKIAGSAPREEERHD